MFKFAGKRPTNLGVTAGQLAPCPGSPNCVCSQTDPADAEHAIAPLTFAGSAPEAIARLKTIIEAMERTQIISSTATYLYAEFTSKLMGYVDDVEFYAEETGAGCKVQVRSASRVGKSDLGVNRKRVEALRSQLA